MRAYVFDDAALAKHAGRFVWLSIDTEKETNAAFVARYPIESWPTLLVIDPERERPVLAWPGSADTAQLAQLFDEGARAARASGEAMKADDALGRAEALAAAHATAAAVLAYREALARARPDERPRVLEALAYAQLSARDLDGCVTTVLGEAATMPPGTAFANVVGAGLACALAGPPAAPERAARVARLTALAEQAVAQPGLLADDRSGLFEELVDAREAQHDDAAARATALRWLDFLEAEARAAKTPEARAAFDPHLVIAAKKAGDPARALPALLASERDLPRDYNAPARLALVYRDLGRSPLALLAIDRALALAYGPRRVRLLETRAALLDDAHRADEARATRTTALALALAMPAGRAREAAVARLRAALAPAK